MTWDELLMTLDIPDAWKDSTWLRNSHLLLLNEHLSASIGGIIFNYSRESGLSWEKEGEKSE